MASRGLRVSSNGVNVNQSKVTKRGQNENIEERRNEALPAKRAALGTLSSNIRIQPFRAAKFGSGSQRGLGDSKENAFSKLIPSKFTVPSAPAFTIHRDEETESSRPVSVGFTDRSSTSTTEGQLGLVPAVTSLSRKPLAEISLPSKTYDDLEASPMLLDSSGDELDLDRLEAAPWIVEPRPVIDIDGNSDVVLNVSEYASEIHHYLKESEVKHRPKIGYMKKQPDINNTMRSILVDWLVEVAEEYTLTPETLYLAVNYIDRFLSSMVVLRKKLQLVGTACMLIASKIEEIYPPEVSEFVYITDDTYSEKEVRKMESLVLKVLSFDLSVPTALSFLDRYQKAADVPDCLTKKFSNLSRYLCELTLQDADPHMKYLPSKIAASSVALALHSLDLPSWSPSLKHYTGHELASLNDCISDLHRTFSMAPNSAQKAIREKYSESRFASVSTIPAPSTIPM